MCETCILTKLSHFSQMRNYTKLQFRKSSAVQNYTKLQLSQKFCETMWNYMKLFEYIHRYIHFCAYLQKFFAQFRTVSHMRNCAKLQFRKSSAVQNSADQFRKYDLRYFFPVSHIFAIWSLFFVQGFSFLEVCSLMMFIKYPDTIFWPPFSPCRIAVT